MSFGLFGKIEFPSKSTKQSLQGFDTKTQFLEATGLKIKSPVNRLIEGLLPDCDPGWRVHSEVPKPGAGVVATGDEAVRALPLHVKASGAVFQSLAKL